MFQKRIFFVFSGLFLGALSLEAEARSGLVCRTERSGLAGWSFLSISCENHSDSATVRSIVINRNNCQFTGYTVDGSRFESRGSISNPVQLKFGDTIYFSANSTCNIIEWTINVNNTNYTWRRQ
jgi:hypothetical protein